MQRSRARTLLLHGVSVAAILGAPLEAQQPLATFRWQLQPFCNVLKTCQ